jgi:hypothetical protein
MKESDRTFEPETPTRTRDVSEVSNVAHNLLAYPPEETGAF